MTTGSSPSFSRIATSSIAFRVSVQAITTRRRRRNATTASSCWTTCICGSGSRATGVRTRIAGSGLFYRFRYGRDVDFICIDTSKEDFFRGKRLYEYPKHWEWINQTFVPDPAARWKCAFCHHPPFNAGPNHHNTDRMEQLLPLFGRAGVRVVFSGHEHNFQHSRDNGIDYFVTGAASKLDQRRPERFDEARTLSWSNFAHFLLVTSGQHANGARDWRLKDGALQDVRRRTPAGDTISGPIELQF